MKKNRISARKLKLRRETVVQMNRALEAAVGAITNVSICVHCPYGDSDKTCETKCAVTNC